jgi:hypothetical protein
MIPTLEGPHISVLLQGFEGLSSLDYAPSLAGELTFGVRALGFATEAAALLAYDDYIAALLAALGPAWYAEHHRPLTYGRPPFSTYYNPSVGVGGRLVAAPRLADPRDLSERLAAYEALCAAIEGPEVATTFLPLVDWVALPILRDWQRANERNALKPNVPDHWRRQFDSAMSWPWTELRSLRGGLLTPWFGGARPTRNCELFTALHAGLPEDLAYLALSVANGNSVTLDKSDLALIALAQEAEARKLVRLEAGSWHAGQIIVYRSRRVATKIAIDEPLFCL